VGAKAQKEAEFDTVDAVAYLRGQSNPCIFNKVWRYSGGVARAISSVGTR